MGKDNIEVGGAGLPTCEHLPHLIGKSLALFIAGNEFNLVGRGNSQPQIRRPGNLVLLEDFNY